jgi:pimeloyl-ACP methyl ester carboxylesterase
MLRAAVRLLAFVAILYVIVSAGLFVFQRSLLYVPRERSFATSTFTLRSGGEKIVVSHRPHRGPNALLYFGGNAEDVSYNLPSFEVAFPDHALFFLHYRGYGGSTGSPTEAGIVEDAIALFDHARREHERIVLVGRSLGSGVAIQVAAARAATRLVLVTPYDSLARVAAWHFPWAPVRWLMLDRYESWKVAGRITIPTVAVAAEHDEVIPLERTEELMKHFSPDVAVLKIVRGAGHNTISESDEYIPLVQGTF